MAIEQICPVSLTKHIANIQIVSEIKKYLGGFLKLSFKIVGRVRDNEYLCT